MHIRNNAFDPPQLGVPPKTTVTWVNDDSAPHTATSDEGKLFDSGALEAGQTYSVWFDGSGTVTYHSKLDPDMQGALIVGGSASGGNTTTRAALQTILPGQLEVLRSRLEGLHSQ